MYIQRDIEKELKKWISAPEIIAIRGPRQSGKTTLLKQLEKIISKKNKNVHYISFENIMQKEKFEKSPEQFVDFIIDDKKHFLLLDEVQYIKNAGKILKNLYDSYQNIKFIITGSSSLDLNKIGSFLVGRVLFFELYPFSFSEFLKAKYEKLHEHYDKYKVLIRKPTLKKSIFLDELNTHLKEYITFGGYPRVVLEKDYEKKKTLLQNLFSTYLEKDIVSLYSIRYKEKIISSVKYLSSVFGNILKYEDMCNSVGLYHNEAKEILSILENTYVIKTVKPFHKNLVTELKKNPKIYFIDLGLRNAVVDRFEFSDEEFGVLLENYVFQILKKTNYWRTTAKAEVDFVFDKIPIEVKKRAKITRSFKSFINTYKPKSGIIANLNEYAKHKIDNTEVYYLPVSLICQ